MSDLYGFIIWQWRKIELWQKLALITVAIALCSPFVDEYNLKLLMLASPILFMFSAMVKWLIIDGVRQSWQDYRKEKDTLFDTIKGFKND